MAEQLGLFDGRRTRPSATEQVALTIRESARARRLTLRMVPPHTLEVVVPYGTRPATVQAFVAEHAQWIERARREIERRYAADVNRLPQTVELLSVGELWRIRYHERPVGRCGFRELAGTRELQVVVPQAQLERASGVLRTWLLRRAKAHLPPWLMREAASLGRAPESVQLRLQRTRWGSCSSSGVISLNAALMFLEPPLVRYLFVHELCHLFALNHSARFWARVERHEPGYRVLDRKLTDAWTRIPLWIHDR